MNSKFLKSPILIAVCSLTPLTPAALHGEAPCTAQYESNERTRLETSVKNVFTKFEQSIDLFKQQLAGLSPKSTEKLAVVCKKLKETIDQVDTLFIEPIRAEALNLKGTDLEHSNYNKLMHTLLNVCAELKRHFDVLYSSLHRSLQGKPSAINIASQIKPIIDNITSDENFKRIDSQLAEAYKYALSYDIVIEIKPQYRKIIDIKDENPSKTYSLKLAQAFALIREVLEDLRKECRKPAAISQAEMLRIIRSRI
jgi:hypothetical protein